MGKALNFGPVFLALLIASSAAAGNGSDRGGGDPVAQTFISIGRDLVGRLRAEPALVPEIDPSKLEDAVSRTQVESTDRHLDVDGISVTAINSPSERKIVVNRTGWAMADSYRAKMVFALHEYLGILKVNDKGYIISGRVIRGPRFSTDVLQPDALGIKAKSGSALAKYDDEVKRLALLKGQKEIREAAESILKRYFGFKEVRYSSKLGSQANRNTTFARFLAGSLRELLPADFEDESFVRFDGKKIGSKDEGSAPSVKRKTARTRNGKPYERESILIIDYTNPGFTLKTAHRLVSGKYVDSYALVLGQQGWNQGGTGLKAVVRAILASGFQVEYENDSEMNR